MKIKKILFIFISLLVGGLALFFGLKIKKAFANQGPTIAQQKIDMIRSPRPVKIETVGLLNPFKSRIYPGTVEADSEVDLSFRVSGPIIKRYVKSGMIVTNGQPLMAIDPRDFIDAIESIEAKITGAEAAAHRYSNDFNRVTRLHNGKYSSLAELENIESSYLLANSTLKNLKAQLQIAKHKLQDTIIYAPFDGTIIDNYVDTGEMMMASKLAVKIHDISTIEISVDVAESEFSNYKLSEDQLVQITFPAVDNKVYIANLTEWITTADDNLCSYVAVFKMINPNPKKIFPGMTTEVTWAPNYSSKVRPISVPVSAVVPDDNNNNTVWVYDPISKTATQRIVLIPAGALGNYLPVIDGLKSGDQIVTAGATHLVPGLKIRPLEQ